MLTGTASSTRLAMIVACLCVSAVSVAVDCTAPHVRPHSSVPPGQGLKIGTLVTGPEDRSFMEQPATLSRAAERELVTGHTVTDAAALEEWCMRHLGCKGPLV